MFGLSWCEFGDWFVPGKRNLLGAGEVSGERVTGNLTESVRILLESAGNLVGSNGVPVYSCFA